MKSIPSVRSRMALVLAALAWVCIERVSGAIEFLSWFEAVKWLIGIYAASEVGSKGAFAYLNKAQ